MHSNKTNLQQKQIDIGDLIVYTRPTGEVCDVGLVVAKTPFSDIYDVEWYEKQNDIGRYPEDFLLDYVHK